MQRREIGSANDIVEFLLRSATYNHHLPCRKARAFSLSQQSFSGLAGLLLTMYIWSEYGSNLEQFVVCSIQSHSIKNLRCTRIGLTAREDYTEQVMGTSEARFVLI